jgi:predicted unusual protein kinase regulating ubiquinone biosynthesis (AarF/ABC1/UbiB family)
VSYSDVKAILENDLEKKMEEVFLEFEEEPVASASIA